MRVRIIFTSSTAADEVHENVTIIPRIGEDVYTTRGCSMTVRRVSFIYQNDEVYLYV